MNIIDAYGEFEIPEEKSVIEVVEDPVKEILSCYELFRKISDKKLPDTHFLSYGYEEMLDFLYRESLKIFEGKQKLKPNEKELREIMKVARENAKPHDATAIFLSAMHNETGIDKLVVEHFPKDEIYNEQIALDGFGHKLKKNKLLIITRVLKLPV